MASDVERVGNRPIRLWDPLDGPDLSRWFEGMKPWLGAEGQLRIEDGAGPIVLLGEEPLDLGLDGVRRPLGVGRPAASSGTPAAAEPAQATGPRSPVMAQSRTIWMARLVASARPRAMSGRDGRPRSPRRGTRCRTDCAVHEHSHDAVAVAVVGLPCGLASRVGRTFDPAGGHTLV
jgi:hypothetical protein